MSEKDNQEAKKRIYQLVKKTTDDMETWPEWKRKITLTDTSTSSYTGIERAPAGEGEEG